jgi:hypothetical protein
MDEFVAFFKRMGGVVGDILLWDKFGNALKKRGAEIRLFLKASGEIRRIGFVDNDVFLVERKPKHKAKGAGHWLIIPKCWGLNLETLRRYELFNFHWVRMIGYDGDGKRWDIKRSVADCLTEEVLHFKEQGFERQICFHPVLPRVQKKSKLVAGQLGLPL